MVRSALIEVLSKGYVRVARAKGLAESVVLLRHALRTALIPVTTAIGLQFGVLMAGAVVTEVVFSWPGIGWLLVNSVAARDFPVVQAGLLAVSMTFILSNLVVDILVAYLDPRIRYDQ
jgi:ABC-type dipeptide/oligopeptide/nickel transport system permease component